jgi:hypothetical protein
VNRGHHGPGKSRLSQNHRAKPRNGSSLKWDSVVRLTHVSPGLFETAGGLQRDTFIPRRASVVCVLARNTTVYRKQESDSRTVVKRECGRPVFDLRNPSPTVLYLQTVKPSLREPATVALGIRRRAGALFPVHAACPPPTTGWWECNAATGTLPLPVRKPYLDYQTSHLSHAVSPSCTPPTPSPRLHNPCLIDPTLVLSPPAQHPP